jgi:hypothetical protein
MTDEEILAALEPSVDEGQLACREALAAAARLGVGAARIGRVCDAHDIRIVDCQLGCFGKRQRPRA